MKNLFSLLLIAVSATTLNAQIMSVTLKPGPAVGQDAVIGTNTHCPEWATSNAGNHPGLYAMAWTYYGQSCGEGITRSLIRFAELNSLIPPYALITNVTLNLYGVPPGGVGNSGYPNSPYDTDNEILISRIISPWDEATITWGTAPPVTTPVNQIISTPSNTQWNWNYSNSSSDLRDMVQDMVSNPANNFGFMLQLNHETVYRAMSFASSDHPDQTLWPELIVEYELCNPHFTIMTSSSSNGIFTFTSPVNDPSASHGWTCYGPGGGGPLPDAATVSTVFNQAGTYRVCHNLTLPETKCTACIDICTNGTVAGGQENRPATDNNEKQDFSTPSGESLSLTAFPNPTDKDWSITFIAENNDRVRAVVFNMQNKSVFDKTVNVHKGENTLLIEGSTMASGTYILVLSINGNQKTVKLIKN